MVETQTAEVMEVDQAENMTNEELGAALDEDPNFFMKEVLKVDKRTKKNASNVLHSNLLSNHASSFTTRVG